LKKVFDALKRLSPKTISIAFAVLGALMLTAAAVVFFIQWYEGEAAAKKAQELLEGFTPQPTATQPAATDEPINTPAPVSELEGYAVIARLDIDALDLHLPVLSETSDEALKVSVCYYIGPQPGGEGNMVITGHNYRNGAHFGNLDRIKTRDTVSITNADGKTLVYQVYKIDHIKPDNVEALSKTQHPSELSLLTCELNGNGRLLVRCRLVEQ
jgi:sortase A